MLERFGVQGTSDDESDCEDIQNPRYNICGMSWLSMEATNWKQTVDKVRVLNKYHDGRVLSTKSERQQFISGKISTRRDQYVPGLPLNAYNAEWLDGDPMRRKLVRAAPNYDFSHDPRVMRCEVFLHCAHVETSDNLLLALCLMLDILELCIYM